MRELHRLVFADETGTTPKEPQGRSRHQGDGARLIILPPYSTAVYRIEIAFAKLKQHLRARAIATIDATWQVIGNICSLFSPTKCSNHLTAARYAKPDAPG